MKSLLTILLIFSGIMFYSCKENTIDPKDANDYVISISPEIVSTGDTVNIKIKKNELTNQSFRTFINLIEVDPISFTENNDNYLLKARIPTYAKNGEIWLQFNGTVYESNKKFKVFKIDTLLTKIISKNEFEIKVLGYGLNYLKDAEFWFGWKNYSVTSISDTMLYFKFNMDVTNINETFRIKRNSIIYQRNIILKYDYYSEFANPIIEFGNMNLTIRNYESYTNRAWPNSSYSKTDTIIQSSTGRTFNFSTFYIPENYSYKSTIFLIKNIYQGIDVLYVTIDSLNHVLDLSFRFTSNENVVYGSYSYDKWSISCKGVPYSENSDSLKAYITAQEISKYLTQFSFESIVTRSNTPKEHYEKTMTLLSYEFLSNSYLYFTMVKK